jgi:hypothetical protein
MTFNKEQIDAIVSIECGVCGRKFRMNEEVKQIVIGKLSWIKDDNEWILAIGEGAIADIHVKCDIVN